MSVLQDERVTAEGNGYTVMREAGPVRVLPHPVFGWTICHGPDLDFVPASDGGFAIGFPTAEAAVAAALTGQAVAA